MIVAVESYLGNTFISGKVLSVGQLKSRMHNVLQQTEERDFITVFCARFEFDILQDDIDIVADYTVDLDTHKVFIN